MASEPEEAGRRWRLVRAGTDAVPDSLRRLMARATRHRLGSVPWRLVAVILAVVAFLAWVAFVSPVLAVRTVRVDGLVFLDEAQVREAAGVNPGTPLTRVDTDDVVRQVAALPPVARVEVSRVWPSTLRIEVVERVAVGGFKRGEEFRLFDAHGVIFRTSPSVPADAIEVRLADPEQPDKQVLAALQVVRALTTQLRSELVTLAIDGPAGITLVLQQDRMVIWGDAQNNDLKAKAATALLKLEGKRIDVSVPNVVTIQ